MRIRTGAFAITEEKTMPRYDGELLPDKPDVTDYLGPCPQWCHGRPHGLSSNAPGDQCHASEYVEFQARTVDGRPLLHGAAEILWFPRSAHPEDRAIYVSMFWEDDDPRLGPADLLVLADDLTAYAERLRGLSARLAALRVEDMPGQGDPADVESGA